MPHAGASDRLPQAGWPRHRPGSRPSAAASMTSPPAFIAPAAVSILVRYLGRSPQRIMLLLVLLLAGEDRDAR